MKTFGLFILFSLNILAISTSLAQGIKMSDHTADSSVQETPKITDARAIKFNLINIFNGELPVFYERPISKSSSIQVGAGPTYGLLDVTDFIYDGILSTNPVDQSESDLSRFTTYGIGGTFLLSYRYYFSHRVMEGWYISPEFRYILYRSKVSGSLTIENFDSNKTSSTIRTNQNFIDFLALTGRSNGDKNLPVLDYYFGFGIRYKITEGGTETVHSTNPVFQFKKTSAIRPLIVIGILFQGIRS